MADEIPPDWAIERALSLGFTGTRLEDVKRHWAGHAAHIAFARYIAEHEEPPVDPLLVEARELIVATLDPKSHASCQCREKWRGGEFDYSHKMRATLSALRRGMELAREQSK